MKQSTRSIIGVLGAFGLAVTIFGNDIAEDVSYLKNNWRGIVCDIKQNQLPSAERKDCSYLYVNQNVEP